MALESDWVFLQAALPDLRDYILSSDLYWTLRPRARLAGGVQLHQLTIGNLLLSQARLSAAPLSETQRAELSQISKEIQQIREEWRSNWGLKAQREFGSRLNLWQQYIRELRSDQRQNVSAYPNEVRKRTILRLLRPELLDGVPASEEELLAMLDQILRGLTKTGPFIWEAEVASAFPPGDFWYLYVTFGQR